MHSSRIRLGNTVFAFESTVPLQLGGNLPLFQTEEEPHIHVFVRYTEPGEETPQAHGYAKIQREGNRFFMAFGQEWFPEPSVWLVLSMLPLSALLLERGTLTLHASYILHQGQGILFSGPSGIGKSTQAALWQQYRGAQVINGDRVLLTPGPEGGFVGSHYLCGTSGICQNVSAPLKAIVLLDQGEQNRIMEPSTLEIFRQLVSQFDYDVKDRCQLSSVTALLEMLTAHTTVCRYSCRKDESAVLDLEKYLYEECDNQDDSQR